MAREVNQQELSSILGLTTRQIRNLELEGLPHRAEGRSKLYPVPAAVDWYVRRREDQARAEFATTDYEEARARHEAARARLAEIEVAKVEGRLLPVEVVEDIYGDKMLDPIRSALLNMPGRWGAQIVGFESPREGEAALKKITAELLELFSGELAAELEVDQSPLPEDFPGRRVLEAAGIETLAELLAVDDLQSIPGIGPATESRIQEALERDAA